MGPERRAPPRSYLGRAFRVSLGYSHVSVTRWISYTAYVWRRIAPVREKLGYASALDVRREFANDLGSFQANVVFTWVPT